KLAALAGPTKVGKEAFPVNRLKNLLDPPDKTAVILRRLVEIDLLEGRRLRLDKYVITDQCFRTCGTESQLIHGIRIDQTVELCFTLRIRVPFGRSLQFGD